MPYQQKLKIDISAKKINDLEALNSTINKEEIIEQMVVKDVLQNNQHSVA